MTSLQPWRSTRLAPRAGLRIVLAQGARRVPREDGMVAKRSDHHGIGANVTAFAKCNARQNDATDSEETSVADDYGCFADHGLIEDGKVHVLITVVGI